MKQPYNTALYMRLSRDDEKYGDSVSIETQRTILRQFASDNNLRVVDEYVDDGWSGTNFERPDFKRMMDDVEAGKINCIVTKDLSRFGREHVMMDYYLEFMFPEKHIRYIAVTENEDTEKGLSDFVPFKNLFNEWFAKDTSRKVKAALKAKHAAGERTATYAPLGYKKDPDAKNRIVIDEETRWVVEKIFDLAAHGCGSAKIARVLYDEKVPTPAYWLFSRQGKFDYVFADAPPDKAYSWSLSAIKNILNDETYIGNTIHHKQSTISYKNKKVVQNPKEEWVRVENTHEPIISKDLFYQVQDQIATRRRMQKDATTQIFAGLLKCADCGWAMTFARNANAKNPYGYYVCGKHRAYRYKGGECTRHYLRYDVLYTYVLERLKHWAILAKKDEDKLLEDLLKSGDRERAAAAKKQTAELKKAEKRKAELDNMFAKMYEDWAAGRITESNFNMLSQRYQKEQEEQEQKIEACKTALSAGKQTVEDAQKWVELIKQIGVPKELTAELLNTLIEKIIVHEATEDDFGFRQQEIEIIFRFVGKID